MIRGAPIRTIAIAGEGIVAWLAAAAIKKRLPWLTVTIVASPVPDNALADRLGIALPSIVEFHSDIGLTEADTVVRLGSGFRLGTRFEGWTGPASSYVHAYGPYGRPFGTASFHHHWIRSAKQGYSAPFDSHSPAAALAAGGRFVPPQGGEGSPLTGFGYGLALDPDRYRTMMQAYARHLGVVERPEAVRAVRLRAEDGFVEALQLAGGGTLEADLFVDATGPEALIRSALGGEFEEWARWFANDRILLAEGPPPADVPPIDRSVAVSAGWRWEAPSPAGTSHGLAFSSAHLTDAKAERMLRVAAGVEARAEPVRLRPGRWVEPWRRNCVAVGDAAIGIEPLEWTNLHLAHNAVDRVIALLPDQDCSAVELWDYNRQTAGETERVRDFLLLHYVASARAGDPYWREAAAVELPASLAHTLLQFRERGRLPFYEEETFSRDSWLAVLLGQGVIPRRSDPLIDVVPLEQSERAMAQMRETIAGLVPTLPSHSAYLTHLARQAGR